MAANEEGIMRNFWPPSSAPQPTAEPVYDQRNPVEYHNYEEETRQASGAGEEAVNGQSELPLRILVPNSLVGSIIGKGGAVIKEITTKTGAKIHIGQADEGAHLDRIVKISGTPEVIYQAQFSICYKMQEESYNEMREIESSVPLEDRVAFVPLKMLVPNTVVGRLIGRGGSNIKKIMAESDAFITCAKEDERGGYSVDRVVTIIGSVNKQSKAQTLVSQQIRRYLAEAQTGNYPQTSEQATTPTESPHTPTFEQPYLMMRGAPAGTHPGFVYGMRGDPYGRGMVLPGFPQPMGRGAQGPRAGHMQDLSDTITLYVPNHVVGAIIGRTGATVKSIARQSSASIKVARSEEPEGAATSPDAANQPDRSVRITGTPEAQFKAQAMIYSTIQEVGGLQDFVMRVDLQVPNDTVGRIIGKKGSQVKLITETTGARMVITRDNGQATPDSETPPTPEQQNPDGFTIITITGRFESNMAAQQMIRDILFYHRQHERQQQQMLQAAAASTAAPQTQQ